MKERPILFSGKMVRAILDGRKTQTRRVAKLNAAGRVQLPGSPHNWHCDDPEARLASPYGQPGDRLWVRERMRVIEIVTLDGAVAAIRVKYEADGAQSGYIDYPVRLDGMPVVGKCLAYGGFREASRITLEITNVRVERLQEISQKDVFAEGIKNADMRPDESAQQAFMRLWESINAKRGYGWDANPWVWVVEFRRSSC